MQSYEAAMVQSKEVGTTVFLEALHENETYDSHELLSVDVYSAVLVPTGIQRA